MPNIQRISFHEDEIQVIKDDRTGKEYVLPKPIVDMFGLSWQGQLAKLSKNKLFSRSIKKIFMDTDVGQREIVVLERRMVHAWLLSISVERVSSDLQDKLLRYQEECAEVLDAHFSKTSRLPKVHDHRTEVAIQTLVRLDEAEHRLALMEQAEHERQAALIAIQLKVIEGLERSQHAESKADLALEDAHTMIIEDFVLKNGLFHQLPPSLWQAGAAWLQQFCRDYNLPIKKSPVIGKIWADENAYPIQALARWLDYERRKPAQIHLLPSEGHDA